MKIKDLKKVSKSTLSGNEIIVASDDDETQTSINIKLKDIIALAYSQASSTVGETVSDLLERVETLEERLNAISE